MELVKKRPLFFIILLAALVYLLALNAQLDLGGDSAHYILLARSMLNGQGYSNTFSPGNPLPSDLPPIFPLMLTPVIFLFPQSILALKLLSITCTILAFLVFYFLLKEYSSPQESLLILLVTFLVAINSHILFYAHQVATEAPYLLFSLLALLLLEKHVTGRSRKGSGYRYLFLVSIIMAIAYCTRYVGVSLFLSATIFLLLKKEYKKAVFLVALFGLFLFPWFSRNAAISGGAVTPGGLLIQDIYNPDQGTVTILGFFYRIGYRLLVYPGKYIPDVFFFPFFKSILPRQPIFILKFMVGMVISGVILSGFLIQLRQRVRASHLYVITYFGILLCTPAYVDRYLLPILPLLLYWFILGLKRGSKILFRHYPGSQNLVFNSFVALFIFCNLFGDIRTIIKERTNPFTPAENSYISACNWIKENTSSDNIILCRKPRYTYFYTTRKSIGYFLTADTDKTIGLIENKKINYIIVDDLKIGVNTAEKYLKPAIKEYAKYLTLVHATPPPVNYVYRVEEKRQE